MLIKVRVNNWEKLNPRSDVKSSSWYRQQNDFFNDPTFYKTSPVLRVCWIYILCQVSKKMDDGTAKINTEMMADSIAIKKSEAEKSIKLLIEMGNLLIIDGNEISTRSDSFVPDTDSCATNRRTDRQTYDPHDRKQASSTSKKSRLAEMFDDDEICLWLQADGFKIQEKLVDDFDAVYLKSTIEKAYHWQVENKKRKAGTFLQNWIERDKEARYKGGVSKSDKVMIDFFHESGCKPVELK